MYGLDKSSQFVCSSPISKMCSIILLFTIVFYTFATNFYISTAGSDESGTCSAEQKCKSFSRAWSLKGFVS
jgi:hypothetical protein